MSFGTHLDAAVDTPGAHLNFLWVLPPGNNLWQRPEQAPHHTRTPPRNNTVTCQLLRTLAANTRHFDKKGRGSKHQVHTRAQRSPRSKQEANLDGHFRLQHPMRNTAKVNHPKKIQCRTSRIAASSANEYRRGAINLQGHRFVPALPRDPKHVIDKFANAKENVTPQLRMTVDVRTSHVCEVTQN